MADSNDYGFLIIETRTARGAIPISNVLVTVIGPTKEKKEAIASSQTDRRGITIPIELPAEPIINTEIPGSENPCAIYAVQTNIEGYYTTISAGTQVYAGQTSIQTVYLIPKALIADSIVIPVDEIIHNDSNLPDL